MKYRKLICVVEHRRLKVNKVYTEKRDLDDDYGGLIVLYDKEKYLGLFQKCVFKTVKQVRKERLNRILNET